MDVVVATNNKGKLAEIKKILAPHRVFSQNEVGADIDVDDGNGVIEKYEFSSVNFTSKPITTLGYINLTMTPQNLSHTGVDVETSINVRKTNKIIRKRNQITKIR